MKKYIILLVLLFIGITGSTIDVKASDPFMLMDVDGGGIGVYVITEPVMQTIKVNISEDMVNAVEATGTTVTTISTRHGFWPIYWYTYEYYYYDDQFVDEVVEQRVLSNDIDSLIFVIRELEEFASEYSSCAGDNINNCVLGYVRGIHKGYVYDSEHYTSSQWTVALGGLNEGFIDYVDSQDGTELEIAEFFSAFIPFGDYNLADYGMDDGYSYYTYDDNQFRNMDLDLIDPINSNSYIDLIHMFASMDGIYNDSEQYIYMPNMISWAGDLQTYASYLTEFNIDLGLIDSEISSWHMYTNYNEDFCDIINIDSCSFSEEDLLGDIDAMNIIQGFVNNTISCQAGVGCFNDDYNLISGAMSGYYNIINYDNATYSNRYKMFLTTFNMRDGEIVDYDFYEELEKEIHDKMYIKENSDGTFTDRGYLITCSTTKLCDDDNVKASFSDRKKATELFYEYIIYMSSKPYYS